MVAAALIVAACTDTPSDRQTAASPLSLRPVAEIALPGDDSRFDYASLDAQRGLLFIAHLGASEVIEVDVRAGRVVRTIPNISQVHGVLVVALLGRVYATATGTNQVVAIDESTGEVLGQASTGQYPDGLAYDPRRNAIWTTNETAGTETIVDAATLEPRGTVELGGEVGNVGYDQDSDRMLVAVQGNNDLAVIDPAALTIVRRVVLPGCEHPHGLDRRAGSVGVRGLRPQRHAGHRRSEHLGADRRQPGRGGSRRAGLRSRRASALCGRRKRHPHHTRFARPHRGGDRVGSPGRRRPRGGRRPEHPPQLLPGTRRSQWASGAAATRTTLRQKEFPMLSWAVIGYGAALSAVLGTALVAFAGRERRPAVLVATALSALLGPAAWNAIFHATHADQFFHDAPIPVFPISWQDTGSGVFTVALAAVLLGFGPLRAGPGRRLASLAVLAGLGALLVDIYLY